MDYLEGKADYFLKNKDSLKFYANKILKQSKNEKSKRGEGLAYKYFAKVAFMERDYVASDKFAKKAISIFNKLENNEEEIGDSYLILGRKNIFKQEFDSAYVNLKRAQKYYTKQGKLKYPDSHYSVLNDIAYLYIITERYDEAMKILNYIQKRNVSDEVLAATYSLFSVLANYNNDFNESIKYFKLTIPIYKKLGLENSVLICEMDIAINNYYLKKYSESIEGLKEVLSKINTNQDHFPIMIRSNLFISKSYFDQKDYFNAKRYFKIVEDLLSENPHEFDMMLKEIILESKINFLIEDRKYTEAKRIIFDFFKDNKDVWLSVKIALYKKLKTISENDGNKQEVKFFSDSIQKFQSQIKLETEKNSLDLMRAEFKYNTVEKELELKTKEYELLKIKEKNNKLLLKFLICLGFVTVVFFMILYSRQKKITSMREAILNKENQFLEVQNEQRKMEIEFKNKEIVDFALHITEKNTILNELKNKIKEISPKEQETKNEINEILFFINNTINQNSEKISLYSDAEDVKDSFFHKLKVVFPNLTDKEMRVASLVRMELSSKQIGQQLAISSASVDNYRSVLRKKMDIPKEQSLQDFLKEIG